MVLATTRGGFEFTQIIEDSWIGPYIYNSPGASGPSGACSGSGDWDEAHGLSEAPGYTALRIGNMIVESRVDDPGEFSAGIFEILDSHRPLFARIPLTDPTILAVGIITLSQTHGCVDGFEKCVHAHLKYLIRWSHSRVVVIGPWDRPRASSWEASSDIGAWGVIGSDWGSHGGSGVGAGGGVRGRGGGWSSEGELVLAVGVRTTRLRVGRSSSVSSARPTAGRGG